MTTNKEISNIFSQLADLLEIKGENPFRIRAYRNAARVIEGLSRNASQLIKEGVNLTSLPGIGDDLAQKIILICKTGELPLLNEIRASFPAILTELLKIESLGPKRVLMLYKGLKIKNLEGLKHAIAKGKLRTLKGFGEVTEKKILSGLAHLKEGEKRITLMEIIPLVSDMTSYLKNTKMINAIVCAGSFRRRKETVGDLDFIVSSHFPEKVMHHFTAYPDITAILAKGDTRSTIRLATGCQIDLRVVHPESFAAALIYFTGSKAHNIALRKIALRQKLKLNEYGLFKGKKMISAENEEAIYHLLNLDYIEPEMRENRGEIELSKAHKLPKLISQKDLKGDLHCHFSDEKNWIAAIINKAKALHYHYIAASCDTRLIAKNQLNTLFKQIDRYHEKFTDITVLKAAHVDILENGSLNLPDRLLKQFDFTLCALRTNLNLSSKKQTARVIKAMDNKFFNILLHPLGRSIHQQTQYGVDMEKIMIAANERNCILEVNSHPDRLDLDDIHCQLAKQLGVKLTISSDARDSSQLEQICFGINQARRGWLTANDVINTYSLANLRTILKR